MEVMAGYKQSDVGIIPEDWNTFPLYQCAKRIKDGEHWTPRRSTSGYYLLSARNILNSRIDLSDVDYVEEDEYKRIRQRCNPEEGDVIISCSGTVGRVAVVPKGLECVMVRSAAMVKPDHQKLNGLFAQYYLQSAIGQKQIAIKVNQGAQPNLFLNHIEDLLISLPPILAEQEAIAEALRDADALIEALGQLIAKKRQVKQGAMQELLKAKSNWRPTNLGSIADPNKKWSYTGGPFGSNLKASDYTEDGIRVIQLQNIGDGEFKADYEVFTSKKKADELLSCNIYPGEIILSKMGDPVARACIIPALHERYVMCSDGIRLAVDKKRFNTYFVYAVINAKEFRTKAENAGVGSTRKRIGLTELRNLELFCPPLPEQTAIAEILSDMDAEIAALEAKLVKARQVKQGMMQELLTGRVRLV